MRIAISGSHRVGKTTLAEAFPRHEFLPEPYYLLEEDGHEFSEMPTIEDFELQLERSLECLGESRANVVFDRCPLDIVGYLQTHEDADAFELRDWVPRVERAVSSLDLIVFVPIEEPDRVAASRSGLRLREDVDGALNEIIVDDAYGLELEVLTVGGSLAKRLQQVLAHLDR